MGRESLSSLEKKASLSWLLAFYGEMLTENQREMARLYWEEDFTLAEIAQQFSISRQSVHDTVSRTEKQLEGLEEKLGLLRRFKQVEEGLKACEKELSRVIASDETKPHLAAARRWIAALLDQEEE
ncbi:MAG: hypothetical protein E7329_10590 [Clostridiales bacterium]|nr:hypothetical protein [Clostridiales bacterium]